MMISYRRRAQHPATLSYQAYVESLDTGTDSADSFGKWLEQFGAKLIIENDFSPWAMNKIIFDNAEDEIIFRLKIGI